MIEAMGRGNVPPAMVDGVRAARDRNVPVVVASRCHRGRTAPRYGSEGGGRTLRELGVVFSGGLPASKARILLMTLKDGCPSLGFQIPIKEIMGTSW